MKLKFTCTSDGYASVNSTSGHPPGQPRGICSGSLSRSFNISVTQSGHQSICAPRDDPPGIWWNRQKSGCVSARWGLLSEKIWISCHSRLSAKDQTSLLRFLKVRFWLILESLPMLYRSNYLSYFIYRKIKETNTANKMHFAFNERWVDWGGKRGLVVRALDL